MDFACLSVLISSRKSFGFARLKIGVKVFAKDLRQRRNYVGRRDNLESQKYQRQRRAREKRKNAQRAILGFF